MKHLKKLSVAIMMVTLFSGTFTSCIDNEVSPLVEAIYEAQADLIAAQAGVQNAEAALLLAQANAEVAATNHLNAITSNYIATSAQELLALVAETELAVEEARIAMLLAQAKFDQELIQIAAAIRAASNIEAGIYAGKYATAMSQLATLKGERLELLQSIAEKELYMKSVVVDAEMTWETYLAGLERDVLVKEASVASNAAFIVRANAYLGDVDAMEDAIVVAEAAVTAKQAEIDALDDERDQINEDIAANGNFDDFRDAYEVLVEELNDYKSDLKVQQDLAVKLNTVTIPGLETAIADYAGTTTTLLNAKNAAVAAVGQSTATPLTGLKGSIQTIVNTLGTEFGTPTWTDDPKEDDEALTEYGKLWNAELALAIYQHDFNLLTGSYNDAADALAAAQAAFDGQTYVADLATANTALSTYTNVTTGAFKAAQDLYTSTYNTWYAAKNATTYTDTGVDSWDLGKVGIHTDDNNLDTPFGVTAAVNTTQTYYRVATWSQPIPGSYIPATFAATAYTAATLATYKASLEVANGANTIQFVDDVTIAINATDYADSQLAETADGKNIYFVEVESDDVHNDPILGNGNGGNLDTFNNATNALGTEINTVFYTGTTTRDYSPVAYASLTVDGITYDADGYITAPLTAYAVLWNLQKAVSEAAWNLSIGDDALVLAQEEFDYQQELFEEGLDVIADLQDVVDARLVVIGKPTTTGGTPAENAASGLEGQLEALKAELGVVSTRSLTDFTLKPYGTSSTATTTYYDVNFTYMAGSVRTLTAYAVLWNATHAHAKHLDTTKSEYQDLLATAKADLVDANNLIAEYQILVVRWTADVAALTAEYEALVASPLYAAQQVRIKEIADEIAVLQAEKTVLEAEVTALGITINFEGSTTINAITTAINTAQAVIDGAPAYYAIKAAQIAQGNVSLANLVAEVVKLKADLAVLDAQIAAKAAEAARYLALMEAALAS